MDQRTRLQGSMTPDSGMPIINQELLVLEVSGPVEIALLGILVRLGLAVLENDGKTASFLHSRLQQMSQCQETDRLMRQLWKTLDPISTSALASVDGSRQPQPLCPICRLSHAKKPIPPRFS